MKNAQGTSLQHRETIRFRESYPSTTSLTFILKKLTIKIRKYSYKFVNHKNYNFLDCDWFKRLLLSTYSLAKFLSDSLLSDSLLSDSLLSDSLISQSHSKL